MKVIENCFCTFFVFEMFVRVLAFRNKFDAFRDTWLVFDCCLVASMVWETWIMVVWFLGHVVIAGTLSTVAHGLGGDAVAQESVLVAKPFKLEQLHAQIAASLADRASKRD